MKNIIYLSGRQALLLLLAILYLAAACNKDDDQPNYHEDIVRCKVNGVEWEAFDYTEGDIGGWGPGAIDLQYYKDTGSLSLRALRKLEDQSINQSINISLMDANIGGNEVFLKKREFIDGLNSSGCVYYDLDTFQVRLINILEIDTINYRIVGKFEYSAINDCSDTVHISNGYFDVQYRF